MCTEKERVIKKARSIRDTCFGNNNPILHLCNFLALYLENDEMPLEICGVSRDCKLFFDVTTNKQRLLKIPQGSNLNELIDDNVRDRKLANLRKNCQAIQVESIKINKSQS